MIRKIEAFEIDGVLYRKNQLTEYVKRELDYFIRAKLEHLGEDVIVSVCDRYSHDIDRDTLQDIVGESLYGMIDIVINNFDELREERSSKEEDLLEKIRICDTNSEHDKEN